MSRLYELTGEWLTISEMLEDEEVDAQVVLDTLESISAEIEDKADAIAKIIREKEASADIKKAEAKRLSNSATRDENSAKWLKDYLQRNMEATGKTKFKTELFNFSIRKNRQSVVVDEQYIENIPEQYLVYKEPTINRNMLYQALKDGDSVAQEIAHLQDSKSIRIS